MQKERQEFGILSLQVPMKTLIPISYCYRYCHLTGIEQWGCFSCHNSNFMDILFGYHPRRFYQITKVFRTLQNSCADLACAKCGSDMITNNGITIRLHFHRIWNATKILSKISDHTYRSKLGQLWFRKSLVAHITSGQYLNLNCEKKTIVIIRRTIYATVN